MLFYFIVFRICYKVVIFSSCYTQGRLELNDCLTCVCVCKRFLLVRSADAGWDNLKGYDMSSGEDNMLTKFVGSSGNQIFVVQVRAMTIICYTVRGGGKREDCDFYFYTSCLEEWMVRRPMRHNDDTTHLRECVEETPDRVFLILMKPTSLQSQA